jgi:putative transposase
MPTGLRRYQQTGDLHAINFNCFRKRSILDTAEARGTFLKILEETRQKYAFEIIGYVVMPTHIHLLLSEPPNHPLSTVMQVIKQRYSRTRIEQEVWETRYYDFNVYSARKRVEKLEYIHMNPVTAGLVTAPGDWRWSSYNAHVCQILSPVTVSTG